MYIAIATKYMFDRVKLSTFKQSKQSNKTYIGMVYIKSIYLSFYSYVSK
jgi:hypothetical protein